MKLNLWKVKFQSSAVTGFGCAMGSFFKQAEDDIPLGGAAGKQCYGLKGNKILLSLAPVLFQSAAK